MFTIDSLNKEARKEVKKRCKAINTGIELKTKSIKGYYEPKNVEVEFNIMDIVIKLKAIQEFKTMLKEFNLWQFTRV
ncbi:hypothetical protein CCP1ISM_50050 [Azospirillaceae bacterium]